jgi:hypothetical protein
MKKVSETLAFVTGCMAAAAILSFAAGAGAESQAKCRVMTIHASNKEGKTDEKLKKLPLLKKLPFSAYKSFTLISDKTYVLTEDAPVALNLPVQAEIAGKLTFKGFNEVLKELNFKLLLLKSKSKEPEEINFAVHGKAPFLYVRPFKEGLLVLNIQCMAVPLKENKEGIEEKKDEKK